MQLEIDKQTESGRITYKPIVAKVMAYSKYNKTQFALEGIDDFWQLDKGILDTKPELGAAPPLGTVALWTLQTNPKRGENAKPGSLYRDVIKVEKVPEGYVAPAPTATPATWPAPITPSTSTNATPPATAEDAGYDEHAKRLAQSRAVEAPYKFDMNWTAEQNREKQASIERQGVLTAEGALIAALAAIKSPPDWVTEQITESRQVFNTLATELARLAPPEPAAEAGKDVGDLPWDDEEKKS